MKALFLFCLLLSISGCDRTPDSLPAPQFTSQYCSIFKNSVQSHNRGILTADNEAQIIDGTNQFYFSSASEQNGQPHCMVNGELRYCQTVTSQQSLEEIPSFYVPDVSRYDTIDVTPATDWGDGRDIILGAPYPTNPKFGGVVFNQIRVFDGGTVTFSPQETGVIYRINKLEINGGGTVILNKGTYAIKNLDVPQTYSRIKVGSGDVFLFVNKTASIQGKVNYPPSPNGRLFLFTNENLEINEDGAFGGSLYVKARLSLNNRAILIGRASAENIDIRNNARIDNSDSKFPDCSAPYGSDYKFIIESESDALTCEPHSVTIKVMYSDGTAATDYSGTINLSTSTAKGIWHQRDAHDESWVSITGVDDGQASYTFVPKDLGMVTLGLLNSSASDLTVTAGNGIISADPALIHFRPYQLKSELACNNGIAASPCFTTANKPFALTLTAVGKDPRTKACQVIKEYTGEQQLKFWSSYINPLNPVGQNVEVNQASIEKNAEEAKKQTVAFEEGVATVSVNYPDAGQIQIHARDDAGIGAPPDDPKKGDELQGSAMTIVNPLRLQITKVTGNKRIAGIVTRGIENPGGTDERGKGFIRASVPNYDSLDVDTFDVTVLAVKDCANDPLKHCEHKIYGKKTPSFTHNITLEPSLIFPVAMSSATATTGVVYSSKGANQLTLAAKAGGATYENLAYGEVGTLGLTATSKGYIDTKNDVPASDKKELGRFYPDYLGFASFHSAPVCTANDFAYIGEPDASAISYQLSAYAQASAGETPQVTRNYDDTLSYPVATGFEHFAYTAGGTELKGYKDNSTLNRIFSDKAYDKALWKQGKYNSDLVNPVKFNLGLKRAADTANKIVPDGPFVDSNKVNYRIKVTGNDGEKLQKDSSHICTDDRCALGDLSDLMYGRLQAGNGYGSEYQPIRTTVEATYYDGSHFVPFVRDLCTTAAVSQVTKETIADSENDITSASNLAISNSPLISGKTYFDFSAPRVRGKLNYFIDLHTVAPWLLDSGNEVECVGASAGLNDCISGNVHFGLFRGNDRIIYRMQTFN